jgi:hypothetical protein
VTEVEGLRIDRRDPLNRVPRLRHRVAELSRRQDRPRLTGDGLPAAERVAGERRALKLTIWVPARWIMAAQTL